jgi:hypothetical protein
VRRQSIASLIRLVSPRFSTPLPRFTSRAGPPTLVSSCRAARPPAPRVHLRRLYGYEYRIDLNIAPGFSGPGETQPFACIYAVTIDFGPIVPMDFDGSGTLSSGYFVTEGGLGVIAPNSVFQDGSQVTFTFAAEADTGCSPRCALAPAVSSSDSCPQSHLSIPLLSLTVPPILEAPNKRSRWNRRGTHSQVGSVRRDSPDH